MAQSPIPKNLAGHQTHFTGDLIWVCGSCGFRSAVLAGHVSYRALFLEKCGVCFQCADRIEKEIGPITDSEHPFGPEFDKTGHRLVPKNSTEIFPRLEGEK